MDFSGLLPYQHAPAQHLLDVVQSRGAVFDASDMGVGKTYMTLAVLRELDLPTLVVGPKSSLTKWERTAEDMGTEVTAINYEMARTGRWVGGGWKQIRSTERFRWHPNVKCLVFDECHRCGGLHTDNHQLMVAARQQGIPAFALSATMAETPMRMKALAYLLKLYEAAPRRAIVRTKRGLEERIVPSLAIAEPFRKWVKQFKCYDGWKGWDFYGNQKDMQRLHGVLFPEHGVRVKIDDLGDQFPETQITPELVDFLADDKINHLYREMAAELEDLASRTEGENPEDQLLQNLRQRQQVELLKVPTEAEMVDELVDDGMSVVVFMNFRASMAALQERLNHACIEIHGGQTQKQRTEALTLFQTNERRAAVVQNQAGCESVDMHDIHGGHPRVTLINPPYSAWQSRQITGRVRRAGGKTKSFQRFLFAANTVEEDVYKAWAQKSFNLDSLNDGDFDPLKYKLQ